MVHRIAFWSVFGTFLNSPRTYLSIPIKPALLNSLG